MGNDLKLPVSQRREFLESQKASEIEAKIHINNEITRISNQVAKITNEIDKVELNLKKTTENIEYYKTIIMNMSANLHQIQMEQINESLTHENYTERTKWFLDNLEKLKDCEIDGLTDEFSDEKIQELKENVSLLNIQVYENEELINQKIEKLSSSAI